MRKLSCLVLSMCALAAASPASALTFEFNMDPSVSPEFERGIDIAAAYWSSVLMDDVTVTLDVSVGHQFAFAGAPGAAQNTIDAITWGTARTLLASDISTPLDAQAVDSLNLHPDFDYRGLQSSTAVNKAIGLTEYANGDSLAAGVDAKVEFSDDAVFDFDPSDGIQAIDFLIVALHELGHALGFAPNLPHGFSATTLDLFRYGAPGELASTVGIDGTYFSIDDGASELFGDAEFGMAHWGPSHAGAGPLGVMDSGGASHVTALDLAAFDAMGWDLSFDILTDPGYRYSTADIHRTFSRAAVPEPAAWVMMIVGFCSVGGALRLAAGRRPI